jgi:hypothetical protein
MASFHEESDGFCSRCIRMTCSQNGVKLLTSLSRGFMHGTRQQISASAQSCKLCKAVLDHAKDRWKSNDHIYFFAMLQNEKSCMNTELSFNGTFKFDQIQGHAKGKEVVTFDAMTAWGK